MLKKKPSNRFQPETTYAAAIRVVPNGEFAESLNVFVHECHRIAAALHSPLLAEWCDDEILIDPLKRCPCNECEERNPELTDWAAA